MEGEKKLNTSLTPEHLFSLSYGNLLVEQWCQSKLKLISILGAMVSIAGYPKEML